MFCDPPHAGGLHVAALSRRGRQPAAFVCAGLVRRVTRQPSASPHTTDTSCHTPETNGAIHNMNNSHSSSSEVFARIVGTAVDTAVFRNGATREQLANRTLLDGLEIDIFKLVSSATTPEQWAEWLRVPLEHAAAKGNHALVDRLLGAGADGRAGWTGCRGRTLIYAAAEGGNEGVLSSLLRAGAHPDVNVVTPAYSSRSPLYEAASRGHEGVTRLLIHAGADVNFEDPTSKKSVLHESLEQGHGRLAEQLIMSGADVEARDISGIGATPLHVAAKGGLDEVISVLLLRGADKDALDYTGGSALMSACGGYLCAKPHLAAAESLLAAGADLHICCMNGYTAFNLASVRRDPPNVPLIKALIRHGADVNARLQSYTALHDAAFQGFPRSVDALVEAGADVEMKTDMGQTPLSLAAVMGHTEALLALLQKGAKIGVQDDTGKTPLHLACLARRRYPMEAVQILLRWGADETALDDDGNTPAGILDGVVEHSSFSQDQIERVRLLLARAPADRGWRRRGWLAMLRSRVMMAKANAGDEGPGSSDDAGCAARESRRTVARIEGAVDVGVCEGGQASNGEGEVGEETMNGVGNGLFRVVVSRLIDMEPEVVFRTVLEFL